jgi:hypothetical protein
MGRPRKEPGESLVEVPCKVPAKVANEIADISVATDRSRSQIARKLIIRGLAAYHRDGRLEELMIDASEIVEEEEARPIKRRRG